MAYSLPLEPFFAWLQAEYGWAVDVQDRRRVSRALLADEGWTIERLGHVLAGVLAHDPEQWAEFHRHFGAFFAAESYSELRPNPLDRAALIAALRQVEIEQPDPAADRGRQLPDTVGLPKELEVTLLRPAQTAPATAFRLREVPWQGERPAADRRRPALDWDRDGPRQFFLADVGPAPEPPLSSALLDHLADGMGYFRSQRPSRELHVEETIRASLRAGYPVLHFLPGREICRLLILEDTWAEARAWNTAPRELADGLAARGIPVTYGIFDGLPERFRLADGSAECDLEDWEDERGGLLVLLFTEGKGFYRRRAARVLEDLASWPRLAWIEFRERRFWDACTQLAIEQGLAVFPATAEGLWEMSRALLTEQGRTRHSRALPPPLGGDLPLAQRVERALDDALPWAELCAVLPSAPQRLADALRRRFHPQLPPTHFGRLCTLPGTERDTEGLHFSEPVRQILCRGFYARRSPADREALRCFVREQIETSGRLLPADSLARYACEGIQVRLSLVAGSVPQTPLAGRLVTSGSPVAELLRLELKQDTALLADIGQLSDEQSRLLQKWRILPPRPSPYPDDLVRIPAGTFLMGDPTAEGDGDERPQHPVEVSTFYIAKHPVTWELWQAVYGWAVEHGYQFENCGAGRGPDHPVTNVSWYDAIKWCNARSEREGRRPAYYTDASRTEPYRQGQLDLPAEAVDWTASGYRVPTEAEWEKAARGGLDGHHYPWESQGKGYERFISPDKANFDKSNKKGTTPVGMYPPNGYGLFDMAGNVYDWVWDRWDVAWYGKPDATTGDTRGPSGGVFRVYRGGCWALGAGRLRCACRIGWHPSVADDFLGFRLAGGQAEAKPAKLGEGGERGSRDETQSEPPESSGADQACLTVELVPSRSRSPDGNASPERKADFPVTHGVQEQRRSDRRPEIAVRQDQVGVAGKIRELLLRDTEAKVPGEERRILLAQRIRELLFPDMGPEVIGEEGEFLVARRLQEVLLPVRPPEISGLDIAGALYPSKVIAGDHFDYLVMPDGSLGLSISDVAGKGLSAALVMASTSESIRSLAETGLEVNEILRRVNALLVAQDEQRFVTAILGRLDPYSRTLVYSNAGHMPGYVLNARGRVKAALESTGMLLAIVSDTQFSLGGPITLEPGDVVLLMSDGLSEIRSPRGVEFGAQRVLDAVREHIDKSASDIIDHIYQAAKAFSGGEATWDDITAVVVKVEPVLAEFIELVGGDSPRKIHVGQPTVLAAGSWRVTAKRRFCWPATTSHELEPGKAYHLRILMQRQPPPGMVEIPAGAFVMGDPTNEGLDRERPQHGVLVSSFFIDQHQVTWALWREVYDWAGRHGYQFANRGGGYGDGHPVHSVNWYDVAKWCNACSEREGRDPAYFEDRIGEKVYRQGEVNPSVVAVDWNGEGFRLPTEAEWEKAARGGLVGHHYPWESPGAGYDRFITPDKANYDASKKGRTTRVGSYPANGYGLYDMAGNVREWCWDWFDEGWYPKPGATDPNTRGPDGGVFRVYRGGSWANGARWLRCAYRLWGHPSNAFVNLGFRLAGGQAQAAQLDEGGERGSRDETLSEPPEESGAVRRDVQKRVKKTKRRRRS